MQVQQPCELPGCYECSSDAAPFPCLLTNTHPVIRQSAPLLPPLPRFPPLPSPEHDHLLFTPHIQANHPLPFRGQLYQELSITLPFQPNSHLRSPESSFRSSRTAPFPSASQRSSPPSSPSPIRIWPSKQRTIPASPEYLPLKSGRESNPSSSDAQSCSSRQLRQLPIHD